MGQSFSSEVLSEVRCEENTSPEMHPAIRSALSVHLTSVTRALPAECAFAAGSVAVLQAIRKGSAANAVNRMSKSIASWRARSRTAAKAPPERAFQQKRRQSPTAAIHAIAAGTPPSRANPI